MTVDVTVRVDPHVHSEGSYDGREPVELILEHAAAIELDAVVITDHDVIDESLRAAELAPEYGLVGVPGVEVSTADGHLLAIGVDEVPPRGRSFGETVERVRAVGGVAVVPHPFQRSRHGVRRSNLADCDVPDPMESGSRRAAERCVDAIEVYNSMLFTGYRNRLASRYARRHGYPSVGASDAHYLYNVGRAYTEVTIREDGVESVADVDGDLLVDAIRDGETAIDGKRTPVHRSARQYTRGAALKTTYLLTSYAPLVPAWPSSLVES